MRTTTIAALAAAFTLLFLVPESATAQEIQLEKATRGFCGGTSGGGGSRCKSTQYWIRVQNLGYDKRVVVQYSRGFSWADAPATYERTLPNGDELWFTSLNPFQGGREFVLRLEVGDDVFYDSNGGGNYNLDQGTQLGPDNHVSFEPFFSTCGACDPGFDLSGNLLPVQGTVWLRDLAFAKNVTVIYSRDNWQTWAEQTAVYRSGPSVSGIESWGFSIDWEDAESIVFVVRYQVAGSEHWDNDYGRDYRLERPTRD